MRRRSLSVERIIPISEFFRHFRNIAFAFGLYRGLNIT